MRKNKARNVIGLITLAVLIVIIIVWILAYLNGFEGKIDYRTDNRIETINYKNGEKIPKPDEPVRTGYEFSGWYNENGLIFDFNSRIYRPVSIYAKWTLIEYKITYYGKDEDEIYLGLIPYFYTIESDTLLLPVLTEENKIFEGWYLDKNFDGKVITEIPKGSYGNKAFYAKLTEK